MMSSIYLIERLEKINPELKNPRRARIFPSGSELRVGAVKTLREAQSLLTGFYSHRIPHFTHTFSRGLLYNAMSR